jgi:hypothetical protein
MAHDGGWHSSRPPERMRSSVPDLDVSRSVAVTMVDVDRPLQAPNADSGIFDIAQSSLLIE